MRTFPITQNRAADLMAEVDRIVADLVKTHPMMVGVLLTGGLARGFADHLSDVDIEVFFRRQDVQSRTLGDPTAGQRTPQGNFIEFARHCWEEWEDPRNDEAIWTMSNRWDKRDAKILHDSEGEVSRLLKRKLVFRPGELKRLKSSARDGARWLANGVAHGWVERGDLAAAHQAVNEGIGMLLDYLFLKSEEFVPDRKWKLFYARQLENLPDNFNQRIESSLLVNALTEQDLKRRQSVLVPLIDDVWKLPNVKGRAAG